MRPAFTIHENSFRSCKVLHGSPRIFREISQFGTLLSSKLFSFLSHKFDYRDADCVLISVEVHLTYTILGESGNFASDILPLVCHVPGNFIPYFTCPDLMSDCVSDQVK